ncbi:MAG: hypothetical protein QW458_03175 [Candidatus Micrarchaeaceae archaeon]
MSKKGVSTKTIPNNEIKNLTESVKIMLELTPIIIVIGGIIISLYNPNSSIKSLFVNWIIVTLTLILLELLVFAAHYAIRRQVTKVKLLFVTSFLIQLSLLLGLLAFSFALSGFAYVFILFLVLLPAYGYLSEKSLLNSQHSFKKYAIKYFELSFSTISIIEFLAALSTHALFKTSLSPSISFIIIGIISFIVIGVSIFLEWHSINFL